MRWVLVVVVLAAILAALVIVAQNIETERGQTGSIREQERDDSEATIRELRKRIDTLEKQSGAAAKSSASAQKAAMVDAIEDALEEAESERRRNVCSFCKGTGVCRNCKGKRFVPYAGGRWRECSYCRGTGVCSYCGGRGTKR